MHLLESFLELLFLLFVQLVLNLGWRVQGPGFKGLEFTVQGCSAKSSGFRI
jgi:hypothetical protein